MGKAKINSHLGDGLYDITLDYGGDNITKTTQDIQEQINTLDDVILDLETEYLQAVVNNEDEKTTAKLFENLNKKKLAKSNFEQRLSYYQNNLAADTEQLENIQAWCADLTTDLIGDHSTIEVIREHEKGINIRPGYEGRSEYDETRDGSLQFPITNVPVAAYYNEAIFPGAQRWRPLYRYATITDIDYATDTCTVSLEDIESRLGNDFTVNNLELLPEKADDKDKRQMIKIRGLQSSI